MAAYFWIAVGSALGGMARYWLSGAIAALVGETFPWGTLIVNVIGSFIIGILTVGLTMQGANYFLQQIVIGLVVIGAVAFDQVRRK